MEAVAVQVPDFQGVAGPALASVTARFREKVGELAIRSSNRQRQEIEGMTDLEAPALWEINRRLHRESRGLQATHLMRSGEMPESCPEPDKEAARLAVQGGISLADTLKCYRIGHVCTLETWLEAIDEVDLSATERANCVAVISRFVTEYDGLIADFVAKEYEHHREQLDANHPHTRLEHLRGLIEGRPENAAALGYPLERHHIGVVGCGIGADKVILDLARQLAQQELVVLAEDGLFIGWLGGTDAGVSPNRLIGDYKPPYGVSLAFGNVRFGFDGLRRTHREASAAHLVALRRPQAVVFYDDVILEALALRDENVARDFIGDALPGLDQDDRASQRLRETLTAYFQAEQNRTSTAALLGVHAITVSRHLEQIEERLGHRVNQRRAELEVALRLRSLLQTKPLMSADRSG
jgi:hypothetical protein